LIPLKPNKKMTGREPAGECVKPKYHA